MENHPIPPRTLPPDARIIRPEAQPQRYDAGMIAPSSRPAAASSRRAAASATGGGSALLGGVRELVETILPAVLIALLIHLFLAQATRVEGYSMEPTLFGHQRLIIEKVSYHVSPPERDDIVVIRVPGYGRDMLIKRVIALPGETIEVRDGQVFIDGQRQDEPFLRTVTRSDFPSHTVPPDHIFVMGDNRNNSNDSRSFGAVSYDDVVGHAWLRYWPLSDFGLVR